LAARLIPYLHPLIREFLQMRLAKLLAACLIVASTQAPSRAAILITEWMYNPIGATSGEFVEITNTGAAAVNMTTWSFDDSSRTSGSLSLSSLGSLAAGESALITELAAAAFRTEWNLAASVKVVGGSTQNLSRSDEINIYDGTTLADRLTYDDQGSGNPDGPRTQGISGIPSSPAVLGTNNASQWVLSAAGDGSFLSVSGDRGSPGTYVIPEPTAAALAGIGLFAVMRRRGR
jgi:MYXO-CTERM domain-containing protein